MKLNIATGFLLLTLLAVLFAIPASAQHQTISQPDTIKIQNLKEVFTKGKAEGHIRNFFMATRNKGSLTDYYANAIGGRLGFSTARLHGFRLGFSGLFTYNLFSSDLSRPDSLSHKYARFEQELFDIEDPENRYDLDRLDDLFLEFKNKHVTVTAGRFSFLSPLINPQDGRMKPYSVQGVRVQVPANEKSLFTLAWLSHFSPRSTVNWYSAQESLGLYPQGLTEQGTPADYHYNVNTQGVAVAGAQLKPSEKLQTEVWHYWLHNVLNTTYSRTILKVAPQVKVGAEILYQQQSGEGGNQETETAYFPDQRQWLAGGMIAYEPHTWHFSANYLHISDQGRFLFPREFGREQFFVTVPRGRLEGLGNADAVTLRMIKKWAPQLSSELALTKTWLPGANNYEYNKYGAVSYFNTVADINYRPEIKALEGFNFRLLYVGRYSDSKRLPLQKMFYNTNFQHLVFVTQLSF